MIQIRNGTLYFGERVLFDNISCTIAQDEKIALIGRNGTGKSTLLKIISGLASFDEGSVSIERGKKLGYLPQEVVVASTKTVWDEAFSIFQHFLDLEQEKNSIELQLEQESENADELLERYSTILEKLALFDKAHALKETERILQGLGFTEKYMRMKVSELSEGWKMRLVLTKLLLQKADFYLFDEPTNHLDIVSREWFFHFLKNGSFGFMLVTHDKYFLDNACDHILSIERGELTQFDGNFTAFVQHKQQVREQQQSAFERQSKEIAKKEATINRFRASASKARSMQSMIKQLEKIERIEEPDEELPTVHFQFPTPIRSGAIVLTVHNVLQQFDKQPIFEHISFEISRGQKVGLVAANGVGKTTLISTIVGKIPPKKGTITFGHNVQYALFEQDQSRVLDPKKTVLQEVLDACTRKTEAAIRGMLGTFLFSGDDVYKKISVLSGGERNRVAMVKVLLQDANFLILDEPTNHLDVYTQEILLQALQQYQGTLLLVCHDHDFLGRLANRIIELTQTDAHSFPGTYDEYLAHKEYLAQQNIQSKEAENHSVSQTKSTTKKVATEKDDHEQTRKIKSLEQKIKKAEQEIETVGQQLASVEYNSTEYHKLVSRLSVLEKNLSSFMQEWEYMMQSYTR